MNKRHTFGKMSIEVYDQKNTLIREIPAGKSAGINVVQMTTNYDRPRIPPSETRESIGGSLFGPSLPAGTYQVKVIKGKEEFKTTFTLAYPENSPYTLEDRKVKQDAAMRMYNLCEELAYIYDAQVDLLGQANSAKEKNPKLTKTLNPYIKEIEDQNAIIVFKGGDFYVATEERMTERVAELYGSINSYPGRPGQSQLDRVKGLEEEVATVKNKFSEFKGVKLDKVNSSLSKANVPVLKVKTEEEFKSTRDNAGSSGQQLQMLLNHFRLR